MLALVTGASAGFGYSISKKLIESGYKVIGCGRRAEKLEKLQKQLGENFYPLVFDMTDTAENINKLFKELPNEFQIDQIDLLVNNAGLALGLEPADKADLDDWYTMIDTNVKGLVTVTRLILPSMVKKKSGLIINMGSIAGTYPYPGGN
ncbi:MAG: SDR family NAD(P)-dependent oxidoreductase, partial [Acinetobacter baumannii]|nr:SDR family NAD(P)-dependent oxidoreductase [Acinetobacter baumannii]